MGSLSSPAEPNEAPVQPGIRKFSKRKFSLLLSGNLIVWAGFIVMLMDIPVFSMDKIPVSLPQTLTVSGIVYNEARPCAIISDVVYGVGDIVNGYTVVRIDRSQVEFEKNGKTITRQIR
ncbi:MAG: hypothetical protein L0Y36_00785 [Planctomycetales bacterium]|nr:hypothetical protein [Planctomycetales bacterium]